MTLKIIDDVIAHLAASSALTVALAKKPGTTAAAIYDYRVNTKTTHITLPAVFVGPVVSSVNDDTFSTDGRQVVVQIDIEADAGGNDSALESIAETVYGLMHRQSITLTGYTAGPVLVDGPVEKPTDSTLFALTMQVTIYTEKT